MGERGGSSGVDGAEFERWERRWRGNDPMLVRAVRRGGVVCVALGGAAFLYHWAVRARNGAAGTVLEVHTERFDDGYKSKMPRYYHCRSVWFSPPVGPAHGPLPHHAVHEREGNVEESTEGAVMSRVRGGEEDGTEECTIGLQQYFHTELRGLPAYAPGDTIRLHQTPFSRQWIASDHDAHLLPLVKLMLVAGGAGVLFGEHCPALRLSLIRRGSLLLLVLSLSGGVAFSRLLAPHRNHSEAVRAIGQRLGVPPITHEPRPAS
eukprot:TRINITY_DN10701_c0_g1_i1.p1 TRINITY_DN10701_c0_g1~~TRINITY_DN10701_c0_g1_i1.p1  ORF type:complete len:263 (-),score=44.75 TRINITY_DN10701_c0_g1_i1:257-1045(-)